MTDIKTTGHPDSPINNNDDEKNEKITNNDRDAQVHVYEEDQSVHEIGLNLYRQAEGVEYTASDEGAV